MQTILNNKKSTYRRRQIQKNVEIDKLDGVSPADNRP